MTREIHTREVFFYIFQMLRPFKFAVGVMFLTSIFWSVNMSLQPYILKIILDRISKITSSEIAESLFMPACAYICASLAMMTFHRLYGYFVDIKMIPTLRTNLGSHAFGRLTDQSNKFYQNNFAGSLASKIGDLTSAVPELLQTFTDRLIPHCLSLVIAIFTLWQVNIKFALANLIWCALLIIGSFILLKHISQLSASYSEVGTKLTGKYVDVFSNILSVRLFARKSVEVGAINKAFGEAVATERKLEWVHFWMWTVSSYSFVFIQGLSLYFLITGLQEGSVTVGDFALVITLNSAIVDCLWNLTFDFSRFSRYFGKVAQALNVVSPEPEIKDKPGAKPLVIHNKDVIFDRVKFHYNSDKPLFEDFSVTIKTGTKVGLVGYSGSGKTTFANLILRLYDLTSGHIMVSDQDIAIATQDSLRSNIAMIPQDPALFHRSLMENIRYGNPDATDAEVIEAAKKAHAHEFIVALPEGYSSLVGERGVKLSGGQRQRIAIARAILKDAPILILDEATSQLDSVTESYIQESLLELMQSGVGKTTLVIAHRLSTLLSMDRILVFDKGRIVEDGSHDELISMGGVYKKLWDAQVGGFLPE